MRKLTDGMPTLRLRSEAKYQVVVTATDGSREVVRQGCSAGGAKGWSQGHNNTHIDGSVATVEPELPNAFAVVDESGNVLAADLSAIGAHGWMKGSLMVRPHQKLSVVPARVTVALTKGGVA
jgi:hypothetical protein